MTDTPKVYAAIAAVAGILAKRGIAKEQENKTQHYDFRGIDDVYNVLGPVLSEQKLCILPSVLSRETVEGQTKTGTTSFHTYLDIEFAVVSAEDGSVHTVRVQGEALDTSDKSVNKAIIAGYKYLVFIMFCIPVKGMVDADNASPENKTPEQPKAPPPDPLMDADQIKNCEAAIDKLIEDMDNSHDRIDLRDKIVELMPPAGYGAMTHKDGLALYAELKALKASLNKGE